MLKLKHLFENYSLAKTALSNWKYDEEGLEELFKYFRISSNAIYPFASDGKLCFLRIAPTDEKIEKNIYGEIEYILYLRENDYPALAPVKSINGNYVVKFESEWGEYYASVFKKVDGCQIEDSDYSDEIMFEYGRSLGLMHKLSSQYTPKTKKWGHVEAFDWIKKTLYEYKAPEFVINELNSLKNDLSTLTMDTKHYGLVHYDFEPDNVFYDSKNKTCNVIDFDDGMYNWYALDIDQVFDSLADELEGDKLQQAKREFIKGYKTEFDYLDEIEKALPLMRRFCNLFSYARLIRSVDEKFDNEPDWLINLRSVLNNKINMLKEKMHSNQ